MASDTFVRFPPGVTGPTLEEIEKTLRGYLGDSAHVRWDEEGRRFFCSLPDFSSGPLKHMNHPLYHERENEKRWFEVYMAPGETFDVITRQQDEFTMNVARGYAKFVARYWEGTLDE